MISNVIYIWTGHIAVEVEVTTGGLANSGKTFSLGIGESYTPLFLLLDAYVLFRCAMNLPAVTNRRGVERRGILRGC